MNSRGKKLVNLTLFKQKTMQAHKEVDKNAEKGKRKYAQYKKKKL